MKNNTNNSLNNSYEIPSIDVNVIFDIYGEDGEEIIRYSLNAFYFEARLYVSQISIALSSQDNDEAWRLFHSLSSMAGMIGAMGFAKLAGELEILSIHSAEFISKYQAFCTSWQNLVAELEQYLE